MSEDEVDRSTTCGLFGWRPAWLQRLLSQRSFLLVYILVCGVQSMIFSYLTVVLSTVEKHFGLKSKEAAWIYSGNEISQICFIVLVPVVGRIQRKPLAMAIMSVISAAGIMIIASPYFAGSGRDIVLAKLNTTVGGSSAICSSLNNNEELCGDQGASVKNWPAMGAVFFGIFLAGWGGVAIYSLGVPYVDDNSENSPSSIAIAIASRLIGPALGYVTGAQVLKKYVYPAERPEGLTINDPRWVGAWWLGCVVISALLFVVAPLLAFFPSRVPTTPSQERKPSDSKGSAGNDNIHTVAEWLTELYLVSKRLFTNKLYMFNLIGTTAALFGFLGFATFLPKYFEYVFQRNASTAGSVGGLSATLGSAAGVLISGAILAKWKPKARTLAGWCVLMSAFGVACFVAIANIKCPQADFYGQMSSENVFQYSDLDCNRGCNCNNIGYAPVCSEDGTVNFFSACQAGCKSQPVSVKSLDGKKKLSLYTDCSCVRQHSIATGSNRTVVKPWWQEPPKSPTATAITGSGLPLSRAVSGYCPTNCEGPFKGFIALIVIGSLIGASSRLPNFLINLRAVEPRDKAVSISVTVAFTSAFAILPGPIVYGELFDSTCTIWNRRCNQDLNCLVYDTVKIRNLLPYTTVCLQIIGVLFDIGVWYYCKGLNIYGDDDKVGQQERGENKKPESNEMSTTSMSNATSTETVQE